MNRLKRRVRPTRNGVGTSCLAPFFGRSILQPSTLSESSPEPCLTGGRAREYGAHTAVATADTSRRSTTWLSQWRLNPLATRPRAWGHSRLTRKRGHLRYLSVGIMMASFLICPDEIKSGSTGWLGGLSVCHVVVSIGRSCGRRQRPQLAALAVLADNRTAPGDAFTSKKPGPPHSQRGFCGAGGYVHVPT